MGNYRQHIAFGSLFGLVYSVIAALLAGLNWVYATVAILLATLGGLLPDLDSPSGVEMKGFTGILGILGALIVWKRISHLHEAPGFEFHLWAMVLTYVLIRQGLRRLVIHIAVHRGMSHSIPTGAVWGALTYLVYPSDYHAIRVAMAMAVMLGFLSHLILDEICSVDLQGVRVNKAFGTALKFWAPSAFSTIFVYLLLSFLCWKIIKAWPDNEPIPTNLASPGPQWPYDWPQSWMKDNFKEVREFADDQLKKLPGHVDQVKKAAAKEFDGLPEDLVKAKQYVEKKFPGATNEVSDGITKAKDYVKQNLPGTLDQIKRVAGEALPSPPRR